ncbi:hypothetical protein An08g05880 [Aspergillus niger]|uniref:Uncharacterized protein n=2 Tax=Aspergillus niger TaxID=5061 RepID=A2QRF9_ASPNC|nr:hypothetical protein An08g05880 [Aspergillus niger]CAK45560.1 hypothetical protein An08g05880 [Aspergillus niger]
MGGFVMGQNNGQGGDSDQTQRHLRQKRSWRAVGDYPKGQFGERATRIALQMPGTRVLGWGGQRSEGGRRYDLSKRTEAGRGRGGWAEELRWGKMMMAGGWRRSSLHDLDLDSPGHPADDRD